MNITYSKKLGGSGSGVSYSSALRPVGGGTVTPPISSAEPDWAFLMTHEAGVAADGSGVVTAIADQSGYANDAIAIAGVSLDNATLMNGLPVFSFAGDVGSYAKFANVVGVDNRAELTTGMAFVMLQSTSDGNHGRGTVCQGRYGGKVVAFFNRYQVYAELQNGRSGGGNLTLNGIGTNFAFKCVSLHTTGDTSINIYAGDSFGGKLSAPFADVNADSFDPLYPLLLGSRYEDNSPGTFPNAGTAMRVASFGIIDPTQIGQCRRYWANRYQLNL